MLKIRIRQIAKQIYKNLEAIIWSGGLVYLALINPYADGHLNMCAFNAVGIETCPGCGLGKSISMIFHGDLMHSLELHPLGLIALVLIIYRIVTVVYNNHKVSKLPLEVYNG